MHIITRAGHGAECMAVGILTGIWDSFHNLCTGAVDQGNLRMSILPTRASGALLSQSLGCVFIARFK